MCISCSRRSRGLHQTLDAVWVDGSFQNCVVWPVIAVDDGAEACAMLGGTAEVANDDAVDTEGSPQAKDPCPIFLLEKMMKVNSSARLGIFKAATSDEANNENCVDNLEDAKEKCFLEDTGEFDSRKISPLVEPRNRSAARLI